MENRLVQIIIGIMGVTLVGILVLLFFLFRPAGDGGGGGGGSFAGGGPVIDSGARIEIEQLRALITAQEAEIDRLSGRMGQLESQLARVARGGAAGTDGSGAQEYGGAFARDGESNLDYAQVVLIGARRSLNEDLDHANPRYLESIFGAPRANLTSECLPMTNARLRAKLVTDQAGPIRVRMVGPAIESLRAVFARIEAADPDLYARIDTAGSLCVRHIRGNPNVTSAHAFGFAVDLNIDGQLDTLGDGYTQVGLTILADFFREAGWYWGAGFGREDSMHFEAGKGLVDQWIADGLL